MDTKIKNYLGVAIIGAIILLVISLFWYVASFSKSVSLDRQFSVRGEGKIVAVPDIAQLTFGFLTEGGKDIANLQKENSEKANRLIAFLKENKIEDKDIKTEFYDISPRYQYYNCPLLERLPSPSPLPLEDEDSSSIITPCPTSKIVGYTINQSISAKIRDLNKVGDVVSGAVEKGANTVSGPNFTIDDPVKLQNQAREEAVVQAKEKAKSMAKAGGFRLGKLISIQEDSYFPGVIPFYTKERVGGGDETGIVPDIEPGSQDT
ncbi:MAG: SIMPL domain-containing protein, partial [Patescibacteria group bacterium]